MSKKTGKNTVSSSDFRANPGATLDLAKHGTVTVLSDDGKTIAAMIAIPKVDSKGRVSFKD